MNTTTNGTHQTEIVADPALPTIRITREFAARAARVFRAYTDPDLFVQWIGPRSVDTRIDHWDARTGGGYRYASVRDEFEARFYGSFHEVRPNERLVQTFTFEGAPDGVSLETMTFEDLPDGRCRVVGLSVVDSIELRDLIMSSGMDVGVLEGYAKLDELLARA
jgi:uncharacterized protein YndB with AHSA1/START domain